MRAWMGALLAAAVVALSGCGYNALQQQDEAVKAAWSEVVNQYQRRADLIPIDDLGPGGLHRQGLRGAGAEGSDRRDRGARQGQLHPGDARAAQRSATLPAVPGRTGRADASARPADGGRRELSAAEVGSELQL